jgi:hypothetical protein
MKLMRVAMGQRCEMVKQRVVILKSVSPKRLELPSQ